MKTKKSIVIEFCIQNDITEKQYYGKEKVGGSLYLGGLTSIPEGFNPTVGGSLDLRSLTSIPEGFNPTVGGSLYLSNGLKFNYKKLPNGYLLSWQDGKYLLADGIFTEVIRHRGNVYHVRKIGQKEIIYLITDGNGFD